jgi:carboxyl-terminal processing protease
MSTLRTVATAAASVLVAMALLGGGGQLRSFAGSSYEELALITNVIHLVEQHYVTEVEQHELVEGALTGMLNVLDPHTTFLTKDLFRETQVETKGEFFGLGIEITKRDGYVVVVAPIDGTPAARKGIRAKDQIVAVCPDATEESCQSTQEMNLYEAVKLMRGPRGTKIMIQILREGWVAPKPVVIVRDAIRVPSVRVHLVEPGLPYVRLTQFQERTARELEEELQTASETPGGLRGVVLDLRDNPGGLLEQAVKVADLFLPEGRIVFTEGRGEGSRMEWHAHADGTQPSYPIVVLVNGGSASASEIVAGSLQDHHRALVVGTETFGKGSVQTIIPFDDGSGLRLTTALYYLPSGRSIQEVRIQPDIVVEPYTEPQLAAMDEGGTAPTIGEEHLPGHIVSEESEADSEDDRTEEFLERLTRDRQLTRAIDLLKSWNVFSQLRADGGSNPGPSADREIE